MYTSQSLLCGIQSIQTEAEGKSRASWGRLTSWREPGSPLGPCQWVGPGWDLDSQHWWRWSHYRQSGHRPELQRSCWDPRCQRRLVVVLVCPEHFCEEVLGCTGVGTGPPQRPGPFWSLAGFVGAATHTGFSWWAFWEVGSVSRLSGFVYLKLSRKAELPQRKKANPLSSTEVWRSCHFIVKAICFKWLVDFIVSVFPHQQAHKGFMLLRSSDHVTTVHPHLSHRFSLFFLTVIMI